MKARSEFQAILEEKLGRTSEVQAVPANKRVPVSRKSSGRENFEAAAFGSNQGDIISTSDFLSRFLNRAEKNLKKLHQNSMKSYSETPEPKKKVTPFFEPPILVKPKVRVKRVRTFDQNKAIEIFVKFGERLVDDCSTDDEIKSAYRRLAKKFHPDRNQNKNEESFKIISGAYKKLIS